MVIDLWHGLQEGPVLDTFETIVQEWNVEQQETGFYVKLTGFSDYGAPAKEALANLTSEAPDLVLAPEYLTGAMLQALKEGKLLAADEVIEPMLMEEIAEIVKLTFSDREGRLKCLPLNPACGVLFTNTEMLQAIGKAADFVPSSLEELEDVCREMIEKGVASHGYSCAWPASYLVETPFAQQNLPLVEPENGRQSFGKYCLEQEWLKQHFLDLRRLQKEKVFLYAGQDNLSRKPFIERKVAFYMQGSSHAALLQKEAPFAIGCGPLPTLVRAQTVKYAFPLGGASLWVLNHEKIQSKIRAVRAFMTFLASKKFQAGWHKATAYVPVNAVLVKELQGFYRDHPLHKAVVAQTLEAPLGPYSLGIHAPNYAVARKALFSLIERILSGNEEIAPLLREFDETYSY